MNNNTELYEVMATSLVEFQQNLSVANEAKNQGIADYCKQQIVYNCSGINKYGHFEGVMEVLNSRLEGAKPVERAFIEQAITSMNAEQVASRLTAFGQDRQAAINDNAAYVDAGCALYDEVDWVPQDLVHPVDDNFAIKLSNPGIFGAEAPAIAEAQLALRIANPDLFITQAPAQEQ